MFTIRPFEATDTDYHTMLEIDTAVYPDLPETVEQVRHRDANRDPTFMHHRDFILFQDQVIAFGQYGQSQWSYHPEKYYWICRVHPERDHPDVRPFYLEHVRGVLAEHNPLALHSGALEDNTTTIDFLIANGFVEQLRENRSQLDVSTFDPSAFRTEIDGVRIVRLSELQTEDPDWKMKLYELEWELTQDVPSSDPPQKRTFENFEGQLLNGPGFSSEACWVALDGEHYVGVRFFWVNRLPDKALDTALTGVVRSHRGRGLATALKVIGIQWAKAAGVKTIDTFNEQNNPMYQINRRLGFQPKPGWVEFEKRLRDETNQSC